MVELAYVFIACVCYELDAFAFAEILQLFVVGFIVRPTSYRQQHVGRHRFDELVDAFVGHQSANVEDSIAFGPFDRQPEECAIDSMPLITSDRRFGVGKAMRP